MCDKQLKGKKDKYILNSLMYVIAMGLSLKFQFNSNIASWDKNRTSSMKFKFQVSVHQIVILIPYS